MQTASKAAPFRRDWVAKTSAGTLLGFTLALSCSGLFSWCAGDMALTIKAQLAMWMVAPIWLGTLACVYLFSSGWRAWAWLGAANLLMFGAWFATRLF
jgi:hypothetical protein